MFPSVSLASVAFAIPAVLGPEAIATGFDPGSLASADVVLFFLIGLLGGAHCIGMCGPIVTIYSGRLQETDRTRGNALTLYELRQHALFNLGRTAGYAVIGGLFGLLGGVLYLTTDSVTAIASLVRGSMGILVGAFVIAIGIYYLLGRTGAGIESYLPNVGGSRAYGFVIQRVDRWVAGPGIVGLGAVHGLLPCPILYPAFLYAFAVGSPTRGALLLAALGAGTIPAVFIYGTVVESVDPVRRRQLHRVLGAAFIVLGYIPLSHGLMLFGIHLPHLELPIYQPLADGHGALAPIFDAGAAIPEVRIGGE